MSYPYKSAAVISTQRTHLKTPYKLACIRNSINGDPIQWLHDQLSDRNSSEACCHTRFEALGPCMTAVTAGVHAAVAGRATDREFRAVPDQKAARHDTTPGGVEPWRTCQNRTVRKPYDTYRSCSSHAPTHILCTAVHLGGDIRLAVRSPATAGRVLWGASGINAGITKTRHPIPTRQCTELAADVARASPKP